MLIDIFSCFEDVRSSWSKFQNEADFYAFQSIDWCTQWYRTIGKTLNLELCLVLLTNEKRKVLMFLPLAIQKGKLVSSLIWVGGNLADYQAPVICKSFDREILESDFREIWTSIIEKLPKFDVMHFKGIPEFIGTQRNPLLFLNLAPYSENSYCTTIDMPWQKFYSEKVKKRIRSDSKRQKKRLSKLGTLKFVISNSLEETARIIDAMIKQRQWLCRATGRKDHFEKESLGDFYQQSARSLVQKGLLHVSALQLDDKILATHWGMTLGERFYYLMPSYEGGAWRKYSCGRLLLEYLMEWAFEKELQIFDFTVGGEQYKNVWCDQEMKLYEYLDTKTIKGKAYFFAQKIFSVLQRINMYAKRKPKLDKLVRKLKRLFRGYNSYE